MLGGLATVLRKKSKQMIQAVSIFIPYLDGNLVISRLKYRHEVSGDIIMFDGTLISYRRLVGLGLGSFAKFAKRINLRKGRIIQVD